MNIVLADDDPVVTAALKTILEADPQIHVADVGSSGEEAVVLYRKHKPDLALLDIRMQGMSGLEAAEQILREHPSAKILFLTTFSDDEYILSSLRMGAMGYMLKQDFDRIVPALYAAQAGQRVLGGEVYARLPQLIGQPEMKDFSRFGIEPREERIIELVAQGLSNREIAEKVYLSEGTVRNYLSVILEKLDLRDRTQLAVFYYRHQGG